MADHFSAFLMNFTFIIKHCHTHILANLARFATFDVLFYILDLLVLKTSRSLINPGYQTMENLAIRLNYVMVFVDKVLTLRVKFIFHLMEMFSGKNQLWQYQYRHGFVLTQTGWDKIPFIDSFTILFNFISLCYLGSIQLMQV